MDDIQIPNYLIYLPKACPDNHGLQLDNGRAHSP